MYDNDDENVDLSKIPDDFIVKFFYGSISVLSLYILYKLNNRK